MRKHINSLQRKGELDQDRKEKLFDPKLSYNECRGDIFCNFRNNEEIIAI